MRLPRRYAVLGILALLALQFVWHGVLLPSPWINPWVMALLFSLPLLPSVFLVLLRYRSGVFWGSVAALFYFCHGIGEAWAQPSARWLGLVETGLAVGIIVASSWGGIKARLSKRKNTNNHLPE